MHGRRFVRIEVRAPKIFEGEPSDVIGEPIESVGRFGKLLVFVLEGEHVLTIHLKMTGQLIWKAKAEAIEHDMDRLLEADNAELEFDEVLEDEDDVDMVVGGHPEKAYLQDLPHKHTHVIFHLDDGSTLYFNDLRKFGRVSVVAKKDMEDHAFIQKLGPEPLTPSFTRDYLADRLASRPRALLKAFLLDQENLAGLGNIYADESLFRAALRPDRTASSLGRGEINNLHEGIQETLELAILYGGSSSSDYVNAVGDKGTFLRIANVYHRTGETCNRCNQGIIERIKIAGRSTHFCPVCQH